MMAKLEVEELPVKEVKLTYREYDSDGKQIKKSGVILCFYENYLPTVGEGECYPKINIDGLILGAK